MSDGRRVSDVLAEAKARGIGRLDTQQLLAHVTGRSRAWLLAHDDAELDPAQAGEVAALLGRRALGEPLAYLVGEQEFHGLLLRVDRHVLIPRPDTEVLVDWAIELLSGVIGDPAVAVDLGTGSGAVALAIKRARPALEMAATDASRSALDVARFNAVRLGLAIEFLQGSWWTPLAGRRFDLVVSNPPYIAAGDPHLPALQDEPIEALTPGGDGLGAIRDIVAGAPSHLHARGWLLLEHGHDQAEPVRALLRHHGFLRIETRVDTGGHGRCTGATWPSDS